MSLEFGLLGTIEARVDGLPVDVGHTRQRCVLAALLVDANRSVAVDELIDRVWGDRPPQRARGTLYGYLSRLRQALASAAAKDVALTRQPGGYVLGIDAAAVDLHRFRDLVAQARTVDDEQAAVLMGEALGLWRGEAFATVDTPWFCDLRQVLERERLSAELDSVDIRLRGGLHGELLPDLTTRAREHALDERVAGQLMLALYRSGRPADALNHYQALRGRLAEELGIDPAPALQDLYQQILIADPRLAVPTPSRAEPPHEHQNQHPASTTTVAPHQLPAPPPLFTGREGELVRLGKLLTPRGEPDGGSVLIAAVCGTGGVGKTWLALRWAHDQHESFPGGQLYADLRGFVPSGEPVDPYAVMRGFLEALGADPTTLPTTPQAQAALYRSLTTGRRLLIVLDNVRDTDQVVPLLPGSPTCTVLVTSRHQLLGLTASHGAGHLSLDTLDDTEAHDLLVHRLGAERVAAEPAAAAELIRHCAGLPLAISVLAARVTTNPMLDLTALVAEVRDTATRLDALETGEVSSDVRTVFASSYRALDADSAQVFRQLAQAPGSDIGLPAAASLTALPPARLRTRLRRLQAYHLVQERVPGRFTCHDLLRAYALELAEAAAPADEAEAALTRVLDHYAHTAYAADRLLLPHRDPLRPATASDGTRPEEFATHDLALEWFASEHAVLTATIEHATRTGHYAQAWRLAWAFTTFLARRGRWADVAAVHTTALTAAARTEDAAAQAESHRALAWACTETGRFDDAHRELARALDLSETSGDLLSTGHTHLALGWLYERQGDRSAALRHDGRAVEAFTAIGNLAGRARALNAVAWDHAQLGEYVTSVRHCEEALAIQRELGDERGRAGTWDTLGYAYHQLGDHTKAIACYEHSLDLNRALSHRYNEAETLVHLGRAHQATGAPEPAKEALNQALAIYLDIHAPEPEVDEIRTLLREIDSTPESDGRDTP
ncbi:AfsR/SARP family transcriptional regulator [Streptomyces sp. NRRL S-920]|uniref:AfsR/SARP family transcriptional regulator n=1 Tax=Streptomyces sp. NRRL S-920 TaxID=1463921 RepID=UPI0004C622ED|nr:BTAD domain-containing putative transcriptional regulator [Streptomyces sp. NRRL S-920]